MRDGLEPRGHGAAVGRRRTPSAALAHDLAVHRRLFAGRTAQRGLGLWATAAIVVPAGVGALGEGLLEPAHALPELAAQRGEPASADEQQHDQQQQRELEGSDARDEGDGHGDQMLLSEEYAQPSGCGSVGYTTTSAQVLG